MKFRILKKIFWENILARRKKFPEKKTGYSFVSYTLQFFYLNFWKPFKSRIIMFSPSFFFTLSISIFQKNKKIRMHTNSFNTKIVSSIFFFFISKFTILYVPKLDIYLSRNFIPFFVFNIFNVDRRDSWIFVKLTHYIFLYIISHNKLLRTSACRGGSIARHLDSAEMQVLSSEANTRSPLHVQ